MGKCFVCNKKSPSLIEFTKKETVDVGPNQYRSFIDYEYLCLDCIIKQLVIDFPNDWYERLLKKADEFLK